MSKRHRRVCPTATKTPFPDQTAADLALAQIKAERERAPISEKMPVRSYPCPCGEVASHVESGRILTMTEDEIRTIAAYMLDRYLDRHWRFRFEDTLPIRGGGGDLAGHTSWDQRIIRLSRRYVLDYSPQRIGAILEHEIAHALTPEDWTHGAIFEAKLAEIRS